VTSSGNAPRNFARTSAPNARTTLNGARTNHAVRNALNGRSVNHALHNAGALHDPRTRALVTASVATAAWHGRHGEDHGGGGWWRHRHGGFGWVGPVFWPFAFNDIYGYSLWGDGYDDAFWDYGYSDLYAGIFGPYGYDDLTGYASYLPGYSATSSGGGRGSFASVNPNDHTGLAQMCGDDSRDIAGLPLDDFRKAIQPNDAQRAALDDLASASAKAAQDIKAACPTDAALTAPRRLAVMQQRIEAMIAAVEIVQPPLEKLYGLLNDEQKARLNALAAQQRPAGAEKAANSTGQSCDAAQPGLPAWPGAEIDRTVKPTEAQRKGLDALQSATAKATDMLKASCAPRDALTPPARLAAVGDRLRVMLQAVKTVRAATDDFYGSLNDEQKASFDAIGPQLAGGLGRQSEAPQAQGEVRRHGRMRHGVSIEHMIRRLMSFAR
jgi:hypothetical protein